METPAQKKIEFELEIEKFRTEINKFKRNELVNMCLKMYGDMILLSGMIQAASKTEEESAPSESAEVSSEAV